MRKALKLIVLAVAILFTSVQFVRPNQTNPPVDQLQTIEAHVRVAPGWLKYSSAPAKIAILIKPIGRGMHTSLRFPGSSRIMWITVVKI